MISRLDVQFNYTWKGGGGGEGEGKGVAGTSPPESYEGKTLMHMQETHIDRLKNGSSYVPPLAATSRHLYTTPCNSMAKKSKKEEAYRCVD